MFSSQTEHQAQHQLQPRRLRKKRLQPPRGITTLQLLRRRRRNHNKLQSPRRISSNNSLQRRNHSNNRQLHRRRKLDHQLTSPSTNQPGAHWIQLHCSTIMITKTNYFSDFAPFSNDLNCYMFSGLSITYKKRLFKKKYII